MSHTQTVRNKSNTQTSPAFLYPGNDRQGTQKGNEAKNPVYSCYWEDENTQGMLKQGGCYRPNAGAPPPCPDAHTDALTHSVQRVKR